MLNTKFTLIFLFVALLWLPNTAYADKHIHEEVTAAFESLVEASTALDAERYFQHIDTEKFVGLNGNGTNWNSIEDFSPLINIGFTALKKMHSLEFPNVNISVIDDDTAILVNEYVQVSELNDGTMIKSCGGGTQVWSKHSGTWKLVSISASNRTLDCTL